MSTTILDKKKNVKLQPIYGLLKQYDSQKAEFHFSAATKSNAAAWQTTTRKQLSETLGIPMFQKVKPRPEHIEQVDRGDFIRHKFLIQTSPWSAMPFYLLIPKKGKPPFPVALAFHGHGYGAKDLVGLWEDGNERLIGGAGCHKDFAISLCRQGFAVAAPEITCFGERQNDYSHLNATIGAQIPYPCHHVSALAFHLGASTIGLRVFESMSLVDYLSTRSDLTIDRLVAMGISGGGTHTMFSTCMDTRIKACVISGYFCEWKESIFGMHHCTCNYVPGLARFGEIWDVAGLIAPRPILIEAGDYDPIFPKKGVKRAVSELKKIYRVFGREENVSTDFFEGRHWISGKKSFQFLAGTASPLL